MVDGCVGRVCVAYCPRAVCLHGGCMEGRGSTTDSADADLVVRVRHRSCPAMLSALSKGSSTLSRPLGHSSSPDPLPRPPWPWPARRPVRSSRRAPSQQALSITSPWPRSVRQSRAISTRPPVRYSRNSHSSSTMVTSSRRCW